MQPAAFRSPSAPAILATVPAVLLAIVVGCGGGVPDHDAAANGEAGPSPETDTLLHAPTSVERATGDCGREGADGTVVPCVSVTIAYPEIAGGPTTALADSVRAFVYSAVTAPAGIYDDEAAPSAPTPDSAAALFVDGYLRTEREIPSGFPRPWLLEREVRVVCNTPEIVSIRADEASYTGGAHGMTTARLASFDPRTGRRLRLSDWVTDSSAALAAGERAFREERDIPDRLSFRRAGFTGFEETGFAFNDNVMRCGDTVTFHYDPYEVAPYALGPTDLEVSLSAMNQPADSTARRE